MVLQLDTTTRRRIKRTIPKYQTIRNDGMPEMKMVKGTVNTGETPRPQVHLIRVVVEDCSLAQLNVATPSIRTLPGTGLFVASVSESGLG
jgi:hypothetical protein